MFDLPVIVEVTALTPLGEHSRKAVGLWDTGCSRTNIDKHFADLLGMDYELDGDEYLVTAQQMNLEGQGVARLHICGSNITTPYFSVAVTDFDPYNKIKDKPDVLIGMDVIGLGRLTVDSTSGETVVTFELP